MTSQTTSAAEEDSSGWIVYRRHSDDNEVTENWLNKQLKPPVIEEIKLRAVRDFDPKQMSYREEMELKQILNSKGLMTGIQLSTLLKGGISLDELSAIKERSLEQQQRMLTENDRHQRGFETFEIRKRDDMECDRTVSHWEDIGNLQESGVPRQAEHITPGNEVMILENNGYGFGADQQNKGCLNEIISDWKTVEPYEVALTFKSGNTMLTFPPAAIGDTVGWWMVRNLDSGEIGHIPRNRVVIEKDQDTSETLLNELPLELLDVVLENSFLRWILDTSSLQRNQDIIKALASVDFCWFQRITKQRFKKRIWRRLKDFYGKKHKRSSIIRKNQSYLLENIQPNEELISLLLALNCITEEQSRFIQSQHSKRNKNVKLLYFTRFFDDTKFSNFVSCLRQTNQKTVARILETGGGVLKVEVQNSSASTIIASMYTRVLHENIEDLRNRTKPRSHKTDKLIGQLKDEGIEILNSQLDRQTVVVWIWCQSQAAVEHIQKLYESNQLRDVFLVFANIQPSTSEMIKSTVIKIDRNQFKNTIVVCTVSVNFTEMIDVGKQFVCGITKLRNEINVLCRSPSSYVARSSYVLRVFRDHNPFKLQNNITIKEINSYSAMHIESCEKENSLYLSDHEKKCVWKITRETDDQRKIIKWLTTDYHPDTLSVSSDGQLLLVNGSSSILMIYGSDAELIRSIQLPRDIKEPLHAVESSIGNFIITHRCIEEELESGSSERRTVRKWSTSELTRDGQMVIRRYSSSNETQEREDLSYLSLDSNDQVFVADTYNHRLILLDSGFKWNRILCLTKEEKEKWVSWPINLYYDEEKKHLFVAGDLGEGGGVNVYTLSRK